MSSGDFNGGFYSGPGGRDFSRRSKTSAYVGSTYKKATPPPPGHSFDPRPILYHELRDEIDKFKNYLSNVERYPNHDLDNYTIATLRNHYTPLNPYALFLDRLLECVKNNKDCRKDGKVADIGKLNRLYEMMASHYNEHSDTEDELRFQKEMAYIRIHGGAQVVPILNAMKLINYVIEFELNPPRREPDAYSDHGFKSASRNIKGDSMDSRKWLPGEYVSDEDEDDEEPMSHGKQTYRPRLVRYDVRAYCLH